MDVRNRIADVIKLRCRVCQEFFSLILIPKWQDELYIKAKEEVFSNHKNNKYLPVYEKMRDIGATKYSVSDMDITIMSEILYSCPQIANADKLTCRSMKDLVRDRNITDHSGENEDANELYLRSLLDLCRLAKFVRDVDKYETEIPDNARLDFRTKYINEINTLSDTLDDERIQLIQSQKSMDADIEKVLKSDNSSQTWLQVIELYMNRARLENNWDLFYEFNVRASAANIRFAYVYVMNYVIIIKKDYPEAIKIIWKMINLERLSKQELYHIIQGLNSCLENDASTELEIIKIEEALKESGIEIEKDINGFLHLKS